MKEKMSKETKGNNTTRVMSSYGGGLEANTLAMLDSTGAKDNRDANEDRTFSQNFQSFATITFGFLIIILIR